MLDARQTARRRTVGWWCVCGGLEKQRRIDPPLEGDLTDLANTRVASTTPLLFGMQMLENNFHYLTVCLGISLSGFIKPLGNVQVLIPITVKNLNFHGSAYTFTVNKCSKGSMYVCHVPSALSDRPNVAIFALLYGWILMKGYKGGADHAKGDRSHYNTCSGAGRGHRTQLISATSATARVDLAQDRRRTSDRRDKRHNFSIGKQNRRRTSDRRDKRHNYATSKVIQAKSIRRTEVGKRIG
ncbi:hypothetical protein J6590_034775 [Homalodisca vitripennis]|nr:hypothetical protein J6590_034775 [Homalodisca vitripennis]